MTDEEFQKSDNVDQEENGNVQLHAHNFLFLNSVKRKIPKFRNLRRGNDETSNESRV